MNVVDCFYRSWAAEAGIAEQVFAAAWKRSGAADRLAGILRSFCDGGPKWEPWHFTAPAGERIEAIRGADTTVYLPALTSPEPVAAFYALIPRGALLPSHNPFTWAETPGYDQGLQERDYANNRGEQAKVVFGSNHFVPDFVLASTPTAIDGPPVVAADGQVLGGNGRSMMILRVLSGVNTYSGALAQSIDAHGDVFGLRGAPTEGMVLVRVLAGDYEPHEISARLNAAFTQAIDQNAGAVSLGRRIPREALALIAEGLEDDGLASAIRKQAAELIPILQREDIITPASSADWLALRADGAYDPAAFNEEGARRLGGALLGALVEDKTVLARLTGNLRDLLERIAPALLAVETLTEEHRATYTVASTLRRALPEALRAYRFSDEAMSDYYSNEAFAFEGDAQLDAALLDDPEALALVRWLRRYSRGSRVEGQRRALSYWRTLPDIVKRPDAPPLFEEVPPSRRAHLVDALGIDDPSRITDARSYLAHGLAGASNDSVLAL